jgi:hypothetical protein
MKIEIIKGEEPTRIVLLPGWFCDNDTAEYMDFRHTMFKMPEGANDSVYFDLMVTLFAPKNDGDYTEAFTYVQKNVPSGDHDNGVEIRITVEEALRLISGVQP